MKAPSRIKTNREDPRESYIELKVRDYAKALGILSYKFTSPSRRSVPDVLFLAGHDKIFFCEFKRKGCNPTEAQRREHMKLIVQGYSVFVIDSIESGKLCIDGWLKLHGIKGP